MPAHQTALRWARLPGPLVRRGGPLCRTREPFECALPMATLIAAVAIKGRRRVDGKRTCARARCSCGSRVSRPCPRPSVPKLIGRLNGKRVFRAQGKSRASFGRKAGTMAPAHRGPFPMPLCRCRTLDRPVVPPGPPQARALSPRPPTQKKAFASETSAGAASARVLQWPHRRLANRRPRTQLRSQGTEYRETQ